MKKIILIFLPILVFSCGNNDKQTENQKLMDNIERREREMDSLKKVNEIINKKSQFIIDLMKAGKSKEEAEIIADSLTNSVYN